MESRHPVLTKGTHKTSLKGFSQSPWILSPLKKTGIICQGCCTSPIYWVKLKARAAFPPPQILHIQFQGVFWFSSTSAAAPFAFLPHWSWRFPFLTTPKLAEGVGGIWGLGDNSVCTMAWDCESWNHGSLRLEKLS